MRRKGRGCKTNAESENVLAHGRGWTAEGRGGAGKGEEEVEGGALVAFVCLGALKWGRLGGVKGGGTVSAAVTVERRKALHSMSLISCVRKSHRVLGCSNLDVKLALACFGSEVACSSSLAGADVSLALGLRATGEVRPSLPCVGHVCSSQEPPLLRGAAAGGPGGSHPACCRCHLEAAPL